jgi:hypothetical protein
MHHPSFEVYIQFFKLCDEYYFVMNTLHMFKLFNVEFFKIIDYMKSKANQIYLKQVKSI